MSIDILGPSTELKELPKKTAEAKEIAQEHPGRLLFEVAKEIIEAYPERVDHDPDYGLDKVRFVTGRTAHTEITHSGSAGEGNEKIDVATTFHDQVVGGDYRFILNGINPEDYTVMMDYYKRGEWRQREVTGDKKLQVTDQLIDSLSQSIQDFSHEDDATARRVNGL